MTSSLDMDRQVYVTFDLATLLLFHEVTGFASFHDPILDHYNERQMRVLWAGSDTLRDALREALGPAGIEDWDAAEQAAAEEWDKRHPPE